MSVGLTKKLRWFDRAAAAFAEVYPNALAPLGPDPAPHYVCPECAAPDASGQRYKLRLFPRAAVENGELTAEDVPPSCFGGRELVLTCRRCNNTAGHHLEAHARRCENPADVMLGVKKKPHDVRLAAGGHEISVSLLREGSMFTMERPPQSKNANDPRQEKGVREALIEAAAKQSTFSIKFAGDSHLPRRAMVTWLRHAYLALFAVAGYRYIFQPGLAIVRTQIKDPDVDHIPVFLATLPGEHSWSEQRIALIREPDSLKSWAVQFGRYVAFLPRSTDTEFYPRMAEDSQKRQHVELAGEGIGWPVEPLFGQAPL